LNGLTQEEIAEASDGAISAIHNTDVYKDGPTQNIQAGQLVAALDAQKIEDIYSYVYHIHERIKRMETKMTAFMKGERIESKQAPPIPQNHTGAMLKQTPEIEKKRAVANDFWRSR